MQQRRMFFESASDALDATVKSLGGYKTVGSKLRGDMAPDRASQWLRDCLNSDRRERLDPDQLMALVLLGREAGCHDFAEYFAQVAGYAPMVPLTQEDLAQRAIAEGAQAMQTIVNLVATLKAQGVDLGALAAQAGSVRGGAL